MGNGLHSPGDLTVDSVLPSHEGHADLVSVEFRLLGRSADYSRRLIICWVAPDGRLVHYYDFIGCHTESSTLGHAFVVFYACDGENPKFAQDVALENIVCSYRPTASPSCLHVVTITLPTGHSRAPAVQVSAQPPPDDEYRVIVRQPRGRREVVKPADQDWEVSYVFICPPVPTSETFDKVMHTFYVWGDLDFDSYGAMGRYPIHRYRMNQIVPQVMIGRCLAESDAEYNPGWQEFDSWVMQAQYYWQTDLGEARGSKALCGKLVPVASGDEITTVITYSASAGTISAKISSCNSTSSTKVESCIEIERPFPNDPTLFSSWRQFFEIAQAASSTAGPLARPGLNIEYKGRVDIPTLASVCPLDVRSASFPGWEGETHMWPVELFCPRLGECLELSPPLSVDGGANHEPVKLHVSAACVGCGPPLERSRPNNRVTWCSCGSR